MPRQNSTVLRDGPGLRATAATTCLPAAKAHTGRARHTETAGPRGTDGACGPRPSEPTRKVTLLAVFQPQPKQQGPEGRTGPTGHSPQCRTLLSAPTRKLTLLAVFQPPRLKHGALATPKQQGPEGRTGPAGHGPHCLTLLSEPTRKLAVWPVFQPPKLTHGAIATPKNSMLGPEGRTWPAGHGRHDLSSSRQGSHRARSPHRNSRAPRDGRGLRATAPTAFWTYKKSSCLTTAKQQGPEGRTGPAGHRPQCLTLLSEPTRKQAAWPVFQPRKLTHGAIATPKQHGPEGRTGPAGHGRHDLSSSRQGSHRARSPHRNSRAPRDGRGLRATAFWTYKKSNSLSCLPAAKAALATPKQQGPEGRTGPAGHGPHCLTLLSEPTRKQAAWPVFQPPKLTHGAIATPKQHGPEGRTGPAGHGRHDLSSSRQGSHRARSPHRNSRAPRDGRGLRATAPTA